jgi:hypothetical protein
MKTNINLNPPKTYRGVGKVIFIVVLSFFIGNYFNTDSLQKYEQDHDLNLTEYDEVFRRDKPYPDEPPDESLLPPDPLWTEILLVFLILSVFVGFYELSGVVVGWGLRRISDLISPDSNVHGTEELYAPYDIPPKLQARVNLELKPLETIRWIDQPVPRYFTPKAKVAFLFSIPWTAFALVWTIAAAVPSVEDGGFGVMALFGIPFILVGLGLLSSPLWAYRRALKTIYVITNQRAITFDGGRSTTITSYPPEKLQDVYRNENTDGTGDVVILKRDWQDSKDRHQTEELGFLHIRDPKKAEQILKKLADQKPAADRQKKI